MKITVQQSGLLRHLPLVVKHASTSGSAPSIMKACHLSGSEEGLRMSCTNGTMRVSALVRIVGAEGFEACIPASELLKAVNAVSGDITLDVSGSQAVLSAGRSNFRLPMLDPDDFPQWSPKPETSSLVITGRLASDIGALSDVTTEDISRPMFQTVLAGNHDGRGVLAATNSHVAVRKFLESEIDGEFAFPRDFAKILGGLDIPYAQEVTITVDPVWISVTHDDLTIQHARVAGEWPKSIHRIIPAPSEDGFSMDKDELFAAMRNLKPFAAPIDKGFRADFVGSEDGFEIKASNSSQGDGQLFLDAIGTIPERFAINGGYFALACALHNGKGVRVEMVSPSRPMRICDPDDNSWESTVVPLAVNS